MQTMTDQTEIFKVKVYKVHELALLYFPTNGANAKNGATANLRRQICTNKDKPENLYVKLLLAGWKPGNRVFTPKQVDIITKHLGTP